MKRIWGIVLALSVFCAGQEIFAQDEAKLLGDNSGKTGATFDIAAVLKTGLVVMFTDRVDDGPFIYGGSMEKSEPLYLLVKGYYANAAKTVGIDTGFIGKGLGVTANIDGTYNIDYAIKFDNTFGWLKFFNGLLTLYGGYGEWEYDFYTPSVVDSNLDMQGLGTVLVIDPLPSFGIEGHNVKLGLSAWSKGGLSTLINEGKFIINLKYVMTDMLQVNANFAYRQYGPKFYADPESVGSYDEQMAKDQRLNLGFNFLGLSDLGFRKLAADMEIRDMGGGRNAVRDPMREFYNTELHNMTVYPMYLGQTVTWGSDDLGLNLSLGLSQLFRLGDGHPDYAPTLKYSFTASYKVFDSVIPKFGFEYYMNTRPWGDYPSDLRFGEGANGEECTKNTGGLGAYVGVELRVNGSSKNYVELGYALRADTSKDTKASTTKSTLDQGPYISVRIGY